MRCGHKVQETNLEVPKLVVVLKSLRCRCPWDSALVLPAQEMARSALDFILYHLQWPVERAFLVPRTWLGAKMLKRESGDLNSLNNDYSIFIPEFLTRYNIFAPKEIYKVSNSNKTCWERKKRQNRRALEDQRDLYKPSNKMDPFRSFPFRDSFYQTTSDTSPSKNCTHVFQHPIRPAENEDEYFQQKTPRNWTKHRCFKPTIERNMKFNTTPLT